jgi:peptide methionine sulfoxide reductase msrA/msrB
MNFFNRLFSHDKEGEYETERPFSGKYDHFFEDGVYICAYCKTPLYLSINKFDSGCGWPAFDDVINDAIQLKKENDGRIEVSCNKCKKHLGHVFHGENFTDKNTRYCINSKDLKFIGSGNEAVFASGCFWGTQYWFDKQDGVIFTDVGYMGGSIKNPKYKEVCEGNTGHKECVFIKFDNSKVLYSDLVKLFFNTHDPEQTNGQGPDIGDQYLSVIFYHNIAQKVIAEYFIKVLKDRGFKIATKIIKVTEFFREAEEYHHKYYEKNLHKPYCHVYKKIL